MTSPIATYMATIADAAALDWSKPLTCVRVIDGDTIVICDGESIDKVRLAAIDAPELALQGCPAQFYADQARALLATWIEGHAIMLAPEPNQPGPDPYGRSICWLRFAESCSNVNALLVLHGAARVRNDWHTAQHPLLHALQARAKAHRLGMWAALPPPS